jgi:hypothetical protein
VGWEGTEGDGREERKIERLGQPGYGRDAERISERGQGASKEKERDEQGSMAMMRQGGSTVFPGNVDVEEED